MHAKKLFFKIGLFFSDQDIGSVSLKLFKRNF
jgi:hypothetical protein